MRQADRIVIAVLLGWLLWDRIAPASADSERYDFTALVRAVERNASATQELTRAVIEAGRRCK